MLLDHLDAHPSLYGFRLETYILPDFLYNAERYGNLDDDQSFGALWESMRNAYPFKKANRRVAPAMPADWRRAPRSVAGVFDALMREFAKAKGKSRWCEKTPAYVLHIESLAENFPDAKFIHIIRDGRDCAASCARRWGTHPVGAADRWRNSVRAGRTAGRRIEDRYTEVSYEAITADPGRELRRLCRFLDVEFVPAVLSAGRVRPAMTGQDSETIVRNSRDRSEQLSPRIANRIERLIGRDLDDLGFRARFPESSRDPGGIEKTWWRLWDAVAFARRMVVAKLGGQRHLTWSMLWSRVRATVRAKRHS